MHIPERQCLCRVRKHALFRKKALTFAKSAGYYGHQQSGDGRVYGKGGYYLEKILAILAAEKEYVEGLSDYLNRRGDFPYRALAFSDMQAYTDYASANRVDLLLAEDSFLEDHGELYAAKVCRLSGDRVSDYEPSGGVFKYQASGLIFKALLQLAEPPGERAVEKALPEGEGWGQLICVCSPLGGSFKSTYSFALAKYYSQGGRTLFVSFDPFFPIPGAAGDSGLNNLTDVIFYLETDGRDPSEVIEKAVRRYSNLDCIAGVDHWFDIADMSEKHMHRLISAIGKSSGYSRAVIDVGIIGQACFELLEACDRIDVPVADDPVSVRKLEEWKRQIRLSGREHILEKMHEIRIPYDEMLGKGTDPDRILKGRLGRFLEEREAMHYPR